MSIAFEESLLETLNQRSATRQEAIDHVVGRLGPEASINVPAFLFTRSGVLSGKVVRIAPEAVDEQVAKRNLSDATAGGSPMLDNSPSAPGQPGVFAFPVTIALASDRIKIDAAEMRLTLGMTVNAELETADRRAVDYLWSPLAKVAAETGRERRRGRVTCTCRLRASS